MPRLEFDCQINLPNIYEDNFHNHNPGGYKLRSTLPQWLRKYNAHKNI
jgi:hypothetical protein